MEWLDVILSNKKKPGIVLAVCEVLTRQMQKFCQCKTGSQVLPFEERWPAGPSYNVQPHQSKEAGHSGTGTDGGSSESVQRIVPCIRRTCKIHV